MTTMTTPNEGQFSSSEATPNNEQNFLTISLLSPKLRQACEGWLQLAAVLRSYESREKEAAISIEESGFELGDDSCCEICFTVRKCASRTWTPKDFETSAVALLTFDYPSVKLCGAGKAYRFVLPHGAVSPWEQFFTRAPQDQSVMDKIRRLVSRCDSVHSCYDSKVDNPPLPTRVLDISQGLGGIRLRDGRGIRDRYICLSHCWGSKQPLQTTARNIEDHQQHIPWDAFPAVYKEAMLISRELGINYVWIDSLCIIQGSEEDWARECQKMSDVYARCSLTVAATLSPDCSVSMLEPLSSRSSEEQERRTEYHITRDRMEPHGLISVVEPEHGYLDEYFAHFSDLFTNLPLLGRAWTFQEQLLSCRVIHLTRTELVWQCKRGILCECGEMSTSGRHLDIPLYRWMEETNSRDSKRIASLWRSVVYRYSRRELTYDKDKLPGLSGLAHMFAQQRPSDRYLAGLWFDEDDSSSLVADLLWHRGVVDDPLSRPRSGYEKRSATRSEDWVAPSFSWASIRADVVFPVNMTLEFEAKENPFAQCCLEEVYVDVLEADCEPSTSDAMGQVKSGYLKVRGRALHGRVTRLSSTVGFGRIILDGDHHLGGFIEDAKKDKLWLDLMKDTSGKQVDVPVVCVPWARVRRTMVAHEEQTPPAADRYGGEEWAVVLHPTAGTKDSLDIGTCVYNRVGMLRGRSDDRGKLREEWDVFWAENPGLFEDKGLEVHTFTIV